MEMEARGDLNHNRLMNFTRSYFSKDSRAGPASRALPHTFNELKALLRLQSKKNRQKSTTKQTLRCTFKSATQQLSVLVQIRIVTKRRRTELLF